MSLKDIKSTLKKYKFTIFFSILLCLFIGYGMYKNNMDVKMHSDAKKHTLSHPAPPKYAFMRSN